MLVYISVSKRLDCNSSSSHNYKKRANFLKLKKL
jgi:hypothetical protein